MHCSIIICTRNRAASLKKTLASILNLKVPAEWVVELILMDNGSSDQTGEVIRSASNPRMEVRAMSEPRPGKSRALNAAIAAARGEVLLFTDDDVELAEDWMERMALPLLQGRCDAVAGSISLGEELRRPWLSTFHGVLLAWTTPAEGSPDLIGANMGVHRSVLDAIGPFDENLGPGASGFGEEALLCWQMREMGLRIHAVHDVLVIHHPESSRLLRKNWLSTAEKIGRSNAYIMHHWEHARVRFPRTLAAFIKMKLFLRRLSHNSPDLDAEGCPIWEICYLIEISKLDHFAFESKRPRNYPYRGLSGKTFKSA